MYLGGSLFVIALGAILRFAVSANVDGLNIPVIGTILMVVGIVGLAISIALQTRRRRTDVIHVPGQTTYVEDPPRF